MKKKLVIGIASVTLLSGLVVGGVMANNSSADNSVPQSQPAQVTPQETQVVNKDTEVVSQPTNIPTSPSGRKIEIPTPAPTSPTSSQQASSAPAPEPTPTPVTVASYEKVPIENSEDMDCKYTYSDGTTYQWHWQTVEYNQGSRITHQSGVCDDRAIGQVKS